MIVVDPSMNIIGRLDKHFGERKPGDVVPISYANHSYPLHVPVVRLTHAVRVSDQDVMDRAHLRGARPDKDDFVLSASYDQRFREYLAEGGETVVSQRPDQMGVEVSVRALALMADIDTAEILFDMDAFTPA
jgi:hypothetical protein